MSPRSKTPVRAALISSSPLYEKVEDGIGAMERSHRHYIDQPIRGEFSDSLDLDAATLSDYPADNRWDYLLGHGESGSVVGFEPHSAKEDQISVVIAKRKKALEHLRSHLRDGTKVARWLWVASGKVQFNPLEKARLRLDQNGIEFIGTRLQKKHLPTVPVPNQRRRRR